MKIATIVGLGISGFGAAILLTKNGWKVRVTEEADTPEIKERIRVLSKAGEIKFEIGRHTRDFIAGADLVATSPGARDDAKPIVWARQLNIPVIDEIELGYRFCPAKIVAVTGTNGKSTTVTLIGEILKAGGLNAVVCGNIGTSFCEEVLRFKKDTIAVLEVSSFQLQRIANFRPYISVILNVTQNHLDRHKDFNEYLNAKLNIFKNQKKSDWAILNYEDKNLKNLARQIKPRILFFGDEKSQGLLSPHGLALIGIHNLKNAAAAMLAGEIFKVKPEKIKEALRNFKGLEHRFEFADEIEDVRFINDSKATTVDAAMCAIRSIDKPIILIAGGRDKGSDFTVLRNLIEEKVKAIVLIGEAKRKIRTQLLGTAPMYEAKTMKEAVSLSFNLATRGDCVLLSPMCASFDMFKNFEERGDLFKTAVRGLKMHPPAPVHA